MKLPNVSIAAFSMSFALAVAAAYAIILPLERPTLEQAEMRAQEAQRLWALRAELRAVSKCAVLEFQDGKMMLVSTILKGEGKIMVRPVDIVATARPTENLLTMLNIKHFEDIIKINRPSRTI